MSSLASDVYGTTPAAQPNSAAAAAGGLPHSNIGSGVEPIAKTTGAPAGPAAVLHKPFFFLVVALGLAVLLIHLSVHADFGIAAG